MCEFICFSDLHMYTNMSRSYIEKDGISSWIHHQLDVLDQIKEYGINNNIKTLIFGGDLFEERGRISQVLYNITWDKFKELSKYFNIIMNTGNHDFTRVQSNSLKPFSNIADIVTKPKDFIFNDIFLRVIPYGMIDGNLKLPDDKYKEYILLTHTDIDGLRYSNSDYESSSKYKRQIFSDWLVLNGHIHLPQELSKRIINLGAVMRNNFGETHKTYFYYYRNYNIKQIEIKCPEFIITPGFSPKIRSVIEENDYDFFRIDISPQELNDPLFKKYNVFPNIVKVKERKKRLNTGMSEEEEILEYLNIIKSSLNKEKILKFAGEL